MKAMKKVSTVAKESFTLAKAMKAAKAKGHEDGEHRCQGELHPGEGDEGREGHEGHEEGEHRCQGELHPGEGDEGRAREGHEGHEVSWEMSTPARPLRFPDGCASSGVWVSPHDRRAWARTGRRLGP